ncbi:MAG: DNA-processing protein DprA [Solobacterium sp.]|nr:DNA-processing protein DprA [Solobacterium sp.]
MKQREILAYYSLAHEGNWSKIAEAIKTSEPPVIKEISDAYLTIYDEAYPKEFLSLRHPPWVLFYEGNLELLKDAKVSIVGSRHLTDYGAYVTRNITKELSKHYVVVSGLAKGADACAHETALDNGKGTIGIIGSGLGMHYPKENESLYQKMKTQLILSEYPHEVGVKKYHFPWRNRLIAALGKYLFVTQASYHSGTMLTVNEAIALSKEVYCVPYPFGNQVGIGCNALIEQGANILYDIDQLKALI